MLHCNILLPYLDHCLLPKRDGYAISVSCCVGANTLMLFAGLARPFLALSESPVGVSRVGGEACAACHGDAHASMKGVAARYPRLDPGAAGLVNIEGRINLCRTGHQHQAPLAYESDELLGLTAHVALQSRGTPVDVWIEPRNRENFERGRDFYRLRQGQMNLACAQCHDQNWGRKLGAETISQGHGNAYPIYRLDWQTMGCLHRRLRSCPFAVGADLLPQGAPELLDLEHYLAWRASGLAIETPGVRR